MKTVFVATSNKGKQAEIARLAQQYGEDIRLRFPGTSNEIEVVESGSNFEENALLKAKAYQHAINDNSIIFVGDDSGIKIPALNNEPGVYTRRWAGHEMTDAEILDYCMMKMSGMTGDQRSAVFETVLAVVKGNESPRYLNGTMVGRILDEPIEAPIVEGLPFTSIFWATEIDRPIYEVHSLKPEEREGFLTHREMAFKKLFEDLKTNQTQ